MKNKFYNLKNILKYNAKYNVIYGERSNGKTFAVLDYALKIFFENGKQLAYIRRWQDDIKATYAHQLYNGIISEKLVEKYSNGLYNSIYYNAGKYYACLIVENERVDVCPKPLCFNFAITAMEHNKGASYPDITTILFDEYLTSGVYIPNEFVLFMNSLSTIIRHRNDVTIFMCGNSVNKYAPYYNEMGLTNIKNQKQGTIDLYRYGNSNLTVAVEYAKSTEGGKKSDIYFAFNNPKLEMITTGAWELDIYPHPRFKIDPKDIKFTFFIIFNGDTFQCEICEKEYNNIFIFIHPKTTPLKDTEHDLIYSKEHSPKLNYFRNIHDCKYKIQLVIKELFGLEKVFYSDNETGDSIRNFLEQP